MLFNSILIILAIFLVIPVALALNVQVKSPRISLNAQSDCSLGQRLCVNYSIRILKKLGFAKIVGISD